MGHSTRKIRIALFIGIGISILSVIALAIVVLYPYFLAKDMDSKNRDRVHEKKYVTEYIQAYGDDLNVIDKWSIAKMEKDDGTEYLRIIRLQDLIDPIDYLHFEVFNSSADAEIAYINLRKQYKSYNAGFQDCGTYFKSNDPYTDDAVIYEMVYLKDNIIFFAELSVDSCSVEMDSTTVAGDTENQEPLPAIFDRARLENYIINNSDKIKEFVLENLLKN